MNGVAVPRIHALGGGEPVLAYGPGDGRQLLVIQPLFEELNRCRALVAALCRALAERGIGCWLPDLPGTGESARALETVRWSEWQDAVAETRALAARAAGRALDGCVAIRGGALLDGGEATDIKPRWRLSPVRGTSLLNDLRRAGLAGGETNAGYTLAQTLAGPLAAAEPGHPAATRTLRLAGDALPCERQVDGPALWRRAEPARDDGFAALLADDIAEWVAT